MLRPEQMSKLSVTGSKTVMSDVIEALHDLHLIHITDYDGSWDGFEPGDSLEGADETSSTLVTVRALENILDLDEGSVGPTETVDLSSAEERLEDIRQEVNELDERWDELHERRREIDDQLTQMELFADLGIDLNLLWGYDSLAVVVGEGNAEEIDQALADAEDVEAHEVFSGSETKAVAIFGYMADDATLDDALVGVSFASVEVPETSGDPESNVAELEQERKQVEAEIEKIENELEATKHEEGNFLLALEEELTIEAQKMEAPLRFATTDHSFIVEGWIPADRYDDVEETLRDEVGNKIEIEELRRASYTDSAGGHGDEDESHDEDEAVATDTGESDGEAATDGGQTLTDGGQQSPDDTAGEATELRTDGGEEVVTVEDDPPVVQKNPGIANPFAILTRAVNQPKYSEFDPTIVLFLTFPLFFGFMIGDIGYGLAYIAIGTWMYKKFEKGGSISDLGAVIVWMGLWTFLFGILYGEVLGLHFFEWFGMHPVIEKGISDGEWAISWLVIAVIAGWVHLNIGYLLNFVEEIQLHGTKEAVVETGSWILMLNGLWLFIFSTLGAGSKPGFLVGEEALLATGPLGFGFTGFPTAVGFAGLALFALGVLILLTGPWYELFEFVVPLSHTLSYTRLTAVLLAKAGMALAVNLLYWGAYQDEEGFHYMHSSTPAAKIDAGKDIVFPGLSNMGSELVLGPLKLGLEGALLGTLVLVVGHLVVLAVGGTAAIQAIRLEYFEFFEKFYEGGGRKYEPFGHERTHTTDN